MRRGYVGKLKKDKFVGTINRQHDKAKSGNTVITNDALNKIAFVKARAMREYYDKVTKGVDIDKLTPE